MKKTFEEIYGHPRKQRVNVPVEEMITLYQAGWSTNKLGERYGCTEMTIKKKLKKLGVYIPNRRFLKDDKED